METNSAPMRINVSEATWRLVPEQFAYTEREVMDVKGKGRMRMHYLAEDS